MPASSILYQPTIVSTDQMHISIKGKGVSVPFAQIDGRTVITNGRWLKTATVQDEELVEGDIIGDAESFVQHLKETGLKADVFTFAQKLPQTSLRYDYYRDFDSLAVIPITTYSDWLQKEAKYDARNAVKKAARLGVVTRQAEFGDALVEGIVNIYGECPVRQGRAFWHYKKDFAAVRQISCTYLSRSVFVGAYYQDKLIGFIKMVKVENAFYTVHVISMIQHFDKKPTNALIAKAVEICAATGVSHLVYGNFVYRDPNSSLTEFKRRNGFREVLVPRYYVPLTLTGQVAIKTRLHRGIGELLPQSVWKVLVKGRASLLKLRKK